MNETQTEPLDLLVAEQRVETLLVALADCAEIHRWLLAMPRILSAAYEGRWQTDRSEFDCVMKGLRAFREDLIRLATSDELSKLPLSQDAIQFIVERFQRAMLRQAQLDTTIRLKSAINGVHFNGALPAERPSPGLDTLKQLVLDSVLPKLDDEERLLFRSRMAGESFASIADLKNQTEKPVRRKIRAVLDRLRADWLATEQDPATNELFSTMQVTCDEAANILFVSLPYLFARLDEGDIPSFNVANERQVPLKPLIDFKRIQDKSSLQALEELSALDQELGFY